MVWGSGGGLEDPFSLAVVLSPRQTPQGRGPGSWDARAVAGRLLRIRGDGVTKDDGNGLGQREACSFAPLYHG